MKSSLAELLATSVESEESQDLQNNDIDSTGTYVAVKVVNNEQLRDWYVKQGLDVIPAEELHVTIAYSRKVFDRTINEADINITPENIKDELELLGDDGAIVIKLNSPELHNRFKECMEAGATFDYPEYQPHITLTYESKDVDLSKFEKPDFDIILGNEYVNELDLNWKDKLEDGEKSEPSSLSTEDELKANASMEDNNSAAREDMVNPYSTAHGSLLTVNKVKDAVIKEIISSDVALNYEYKGSDTCSLAFITGATKSEQELPIWEFPMVIKDHRNRLVVATDMRKYVKPTLNEYPNNLKDIMSNQGGYDFLLLASLLVADMKSDIYGEIRTMEKSTAVAFSSWISDCITSARYLDTLEKMKLEIVCLHYVFTLFTVGKIDASVTSTIISKISSVNTSVGKVPRAQIENVLSTIKLDVTNVYDLAENIKLGVGSDKIGAFDTNALVNIISNSWHGHGGTGTTIIALECLPVFMALLYSVIVNPGYKRNRIAMIVDKHKRSIDTGDYSKKMGLYLKSKDIGSI